MIHQNPETHDIYTGEIVDPTPARCGLGSLLPKRSARALMEDAAWAAGNNHCRAMVTKSAMEEAGALAFAAQRISSMAPQAAGICQELLQAYGERAVDTVMRW